MNSPISKIIAEDSKLQVLYQRILEIPPIDAGHDMAHFERVMRECVKIYSEEVYRKHGRSIKDSEVKDAIVAALLHDCFPVAKSSPLRKESSRLSSERAKEWLTELSWGPSTDEVVGAIHDHSFSSGRIPQTMLGEALQDADRLEALGAIGLYRVIATGVSMGTQLFDPQDPWAENRPLDDRKFSLDHFYTKLLKLPDSFRTATAREEAKKRADYLRGFAEQLKREI